MSHIYIYIYMLDIVVNKYCKCMSAHKTFLINAAIKRNNAMFSSDTFQHSAQKKYRSNRPANDIEFRGAFFRERLSVGFFQKKKLR